MSIKNQLKSIIYREGWKINALSMELHQRHHSGNIPPNLSQMINRESIRYKDVLQIAEILGYEIKWVKKETDD